MYFPREFPLPKTLGSSLSSFFSKLTSGRLLFPSDDKPPLPGHHDPTGSSSSSKSETARIKSIITFLYKALAQGGPTPDHHISIIGDDLEWWFHGPPGCDYMMRMLTGQQQLSPSTSASSGPTFRFEPRSVEVVGECVIAEGWEGEKVYWVHVWSVRDGMITQFREYFNTWLTVRDVTPPPPEISVVPSPEREKITLWRSHPGDLFKRSLPGLVLAI
ncbi:Wound-induced protein 1 [Linum perenne]